MENRKTKSFYMGVIAVAAVAFISGCQSSQTASSSSGSNRAAALDDDDGVICKMEKRVGSNMMTRVCRTAEQRAAQEEAAREGMLRLQGGSMTTGADGE